MGAQAVKLMEGRAEAASQEAAAQAAKRARGELEAATARGIELLVASGIEAGAAAKRMLEPDLACMLETSAERAALAIYSAMDFEMADKFNKEAFSALDAIGHDSVGHLALWAFEDGSAWVAFSGHEREMAWEALEGTRFAQKEQLGNALWMMWEREHAPFGVQVGAKFLEARKAKSPLVALTPAEARAFASGLAKGWLREGAGWGKGMAMKALSGGATMPPSEFEKIVAKALSKGKEEAVKAGMRRMEELRKERDARMKIHWRDAMCIFLAQAQAMPVYDSGIASFLMSKPGLFGQYPLPVWRKMFFEIVDMVKPLREGESPEIAAIETSASILGAELASQMAHFLYRYHRSGGAKLTAKRVLEQARDRMAADAAKHGLAAAVKSKDPISEEMREASKAASSVEFSAQYGAALALYASLWAKDTGFADISLQARAVVKTMRGAGEISMECFGWFARLMYEFSEGFVEKEELARVLKAEMDVAAAAAEEEKRKGGKITIENEWSGNWGSELASRKVREYLGLERAKMGS